MSRVRQKGTGGELRVGGALRQLGLAYRRNVRKLPGSPDFANRSRKWAVFVNGCFWHQHPGCGRATMPKTNRRFWETKFSANRLRDLRALRSLRRQGYCVVTVWECETEDAERLRRKLSKILEPRRIDVRQTVDHR